MMARIGFKKTFAQGTFDKLAVEALFGHIKNTLVDAGFQVILDTEDAIDVMPMGADPAVANDDVPHWAIFYQDAGSTAYLRAAPVFGANYLDEDAFASNEVELINPNWMDDPNAEITFWFAADGAAGWWWLHAISPDTNSSNGQNVIFGCAAVTSRRYPADQYQGLSTRYGLRDAWGQFYPAYALKEDGTLSRWPSTGTWSPFGTGWVFNGRRHPGSPLPRMAVPQFPSRDGDTAACIYGEFNEILVITDGYAQEEMVLPGWVAMTGDGQEDQPYAVPAPPQFNDPDGEPDGEP